MTVLCHNRWSVQTCAECEEEDFNLLALWEQLDEVKLERNHVNTVLSGQGFSYKHTHTHTHTIWLTSQHIFCVLLSISAFLTITKLKSENFEIEYSSIHLSHNSIQVQFNSVKLN